MLVPVIQCFGMFAKIGAFVVSYTPLLAFSFIVVACFDELPPVLLVCCLIECLYWGLGYFILPLAFWRSCCCSSLISAAVAVVSIWLINKRSTQ